MYYLVNKAIRSGLLIKPSVCENCGKKGCRLEGHHEDYSMPLEVVWLCYSCHRELHKIKKGSDYRRKNKNTMFPNGIGCITSCINKETNEKLIKYAKKKGITKSELVRVIINKELERVRNDDNYFLRSL